MQLCFTSVIPALAIVGTCAISSVNAASCTTINPASLNMVKGFYHLFAWPDRDRTAVSVIGYAHECKEKGCTDVSAKRPLSESAAEELLVGDMKTATSCLASSVQRDVKLNENQWGALASWAYSTGCGNVEGSELVKRLNKHEDPNVVAAEELPKWNKGPGDTPIDLTARRAEELKLFQTPSSKEASPECAE